MMFSSFEIHGGYSNQGEPVHNVLRLAASIPSQQWDLLWPGSPSLI
jgi:hypothetical protein